MPKLELGLVLGMAVALTPACAREVGDDLAETALDPDGDGVHGDGSSNASDGGSEGDGGDGFGNVDRDTLPQMTTVLEMPNEEAFFINDPPPPVCGPDGEEGADPEPPGGTPNCPDDKNREGCPCPEQGVREPCWPGERVHRNRGICQDGETICRDGEFGLLWGACEGYRLPVDSALFGPSACGCFSSGNWTLSNLSPCIFTGDVSGARYLYSSKLDGDGIDCGVNTPEPPPVPDGIWATGTLRVDCAGQFRLCFTIKAGDVQNPQDDDCVIMQECVDTWYPEANVEQTLPDLPSWSSPNSECAGRFVDIGGYGEMTVIGKSQDCEQVDDGQGNPYVFHRTRYCAPSCQDNPDREDCVDCKTGGSGDF